MAAILRVKRRNDAEPLEALVIACKRRKTESLDSEEEAADDSVTAVLKFAGTLKNQEDNVVEHLKKNLTKEELEANFKNHVVDVAAKNREQTKQESKKNRFKVVNCSRALQSNDHQEFVKKETTVIDVEDSTSCLTAENPTNSEEEGYVFDLYYTQTGDDMLIDHLVSVHPLEQELVFNSCRGNDAHSEGGFESEDSNSESNWKNDYPDSDHSENSICEEDMIGAVNRINLDDESDLSSDGDDNLLYSLSKDDVENFGFKYAKYKAKIKDEMKEEYAGEEVSEFGNSSHSEDDEDPQYGDP